MVSVQNVSKCYRAGETTVQALTHVPLGLVNGEFAAIAGPSGPGKTSVLHPIGWIDLPDAGSDGLSR